MGDAPITQPGLDGNYSAALLETALDYLSLPLGILAARWEQGVIRVGAARANLLRSTIAVYQMGHSWTLLQIAANTATRSGLSELSAYFREHADEERDHFGWGLRDSAASMESLGFLKTQVFPPSIPEAIHQLILRQYGLAASVSGLSAFLGYVMALEAFPAKPGIWEDWCRHHGVSEQAAQSPIRHALADQEHKMELFELFQRVPMIDVEAAFAEARACLFVIVNSIE